MTHSNLLPTIKTYRDYAVALHSHAWIGAIGDLPEYEDQRTADFNRLVRIANADTSGVCRLMFNACHGAVQAWLNRTVRTFSFPTLLELEKLVTEQVSQ